MATQTMDHTQEPKVLRYSIGPRIIHAVLASSFLILLITGMVLFVPALSGWAAGGGSRWLHRVGAVMFMLIPVLYLIFDRPAAKHLLVDSFRYDKDDMRWLSQIYRYFMGYAKDMPPQGRLNAGQKLHHASVVIFSAAIVVSGLILWFAKGDMGPEGLAITAMVHDVSMLALTVLLVGHLYFTFVYKALQGMVSGYIPEEEAMIEHPKWVEELHQQEAAANADATPTE
jgi:formate dehydrogenase subunit gamma